MNLGQGFQEPEERGETVARQTLGDAFAGIALPPPYELDSPITERNILEERIKRIASEVTGKDLDTFCIFNGKPGGKSATSGKDSVATSNDFYLVDLTTLRNNEAVGEPVILQVSLISNGTTPTPLIRPYSDSSGIVSETTQRICLALYRELGLSIDSQRSLIAQTHQEQPIITSPTTAPFLWRASDIALGIVSHLPIPIAVGLFAYAFHLPEGAAGGWLIAALGAAGASIGCAVGFWGRIDYLRKRPQMASFMQHLQSIEDPKALRVAVQGTMDDDHYELLKKYVKESRPPAEMINLVNGITKMAMAELSHPRRISYQEYVESTRSYVTKYYTLDSSNFFGWLDEIGGRSGHPDVQQAVHDARLKLGLYLQ